MWFALLIIIIILYAIISAADFVSANTNVFIIFGFVIIVILVIRSLISKRTEESVKKVQRQQKKLLEDILTELHLENVDSQLKECDDRVEVKSKQDLNNYTDLKYLKNKEILEKVRALLEERKSIFNAIESFLKENEYKSVPYYYHAEGKLTHYMKMANEYRVKIVYITSAGNNGGERILYISNSRIDDIAKSPELLMTKGEYNRFLKKQEKEKIEAKKHLLYNRVNEIIDFANEQRSILIVKSKERNLDDAVQRLLEGTVNSIQRIRSIDSDEWTTLENYITTIDDQITEIVQEDERIREYYSSDDFVKVKEACNLLIESQKEFNEYIEKKAKSISELFGKRVVRSETQYSDVYNYIRPYKKTLTPFTAEVSAAVFSSAENKPIEYIVKYFYPYKSQYKKQIDKLRILIEEMETLEEAKSIIDAYKQDYNQYIQNVPDFVLDNDEDGFYSRLGLTIIDEDVLNVEYKFVYTSGGGMVQRSFTVPMNEENITELIHQLENKLSMEGFVKEQRALMTSRLRSYIKERDNYTCQECGNSIKKEPNLLLEIDHIIPISQGGFTQEDNLQTLCWKCNRSKGAKIIV